MRLRATFTTAIALALAAGLLWAPPAVGQQPEVPKPASESGQRSLVNLDHLDWLGDTVTPPDQEGHTTYAIDEEPELGVLWTYADRQDDGTYVRVGGGEYDEETNTWGQGAFNADDISRAAVVYLRHWRATGDDASRERAYQMLRGLTYLQTVTGPNIGNVVLWMQPDGTLNVSAEPPELPDPSDSGPSYWLARTVWALGEGYDAFVADDPAFAGFLAERMDLAVDAVERQVLDAYGTYLEVDGYQVPAWLIVDGADATGEALLGLAPYVERTGDPAAETAMSQLAEGVAEMQAGSRRSWPYGAILPWGLARSFWHAWGGLAPAGLAGAADELDDRSLLGPALTDAGSFTPHLLIATGAVNGWAPTPVDLTQIAYGADSRVGSLLAVADASGRDGLVQLAGVAAAWYFGNNHSGLPMYDRSTGRTYDGVDAAGVRNLNSGAESTIHGQLTMLALDAHPEAAAVAAVARRVEVDTWRLVEAESGELAGPASVYEPESAWTGESQWSGGAGVQLEPGGTITLPDLEPADALLQPVVLLDPDAGATRWERGGELAGVVRHDRVGPQGDSPAPGLLSAELLRRDAAPGDIVTVTGRRTTTYVDALLVQPLVEHLVLGGHDSGTALLRSFGDGPLRASVTVPGEGTASIDVYSATGVLRHSSTSDESTVELRLPRGGFALVLRAPA